MNTDTIYIKNMVCPRCVRVVKEDLSAAGFTLGHVEIGQAEISYVNKLDLEKIDFILRKSGFELLQEQENQLIATIKAAVNAIIDNDYDQKLTNSAFIEKYCGKNYSQISKMFSAKEGISLEQYIIREKISKVKELIRYENKSLKEIAYQLGYSSTAHLSAQFKQVCGFTVTEFKNK